MWQLETPRIDLPPDLDRLRGTLRTQAGFFRADRPLLAGRAPGRLDLMGGIADYSGALVLELPLALAAYAVVQADDAPAITIRSLAAAELAADAQAEYRLADLGPPGAPIGYAAAQAWLTADARRSWAAYVLGCLLVLMHERGLVPSTGLRILIDSAVPPGKGVSSSAALEVATMAALAAHYGLALDRRSMAVLCQRAENLVVGAPCGVMDQMTAACGEQASLLALLCQPAELQPPLRLPPALEVWGIDSGIRHAVGGADYGAVRVGAFMGYRIVASLAGLPAKPAGPGRVALADQQWGGYLANLTPAEWEQRFQAQVPARMGGAEFLARYGGITDAVTRVDPAREYAVRQPTAHPIYEHQRVRLFRALLLGMAGADAADDEACGLLGELMYQSHASYGACGLGSDGTDQLVELVRAAGPRAGLYGAKITGGGSGGTVAILARRGAEAGVRAIAAQYSRLSGRAASVIGGSSPGAAAVGALRLVHLGGNPLPAGT